jgi:hypothetical protein
MDAAHSVRIAMNFFGRGGGFHRLRFEPEALSESFREPRTHHARVATGTVVGSSVMELE